MPVIITNKLKRLAEYWDKVYHNFYQANKDQEKRKTAIEKIEAQLALLMTISKTAYSNPTNFQLCLTLQKLNLIYFGRNTRLLGQTNMA
jgi:hypothetical protein